MAELTLDQKFELILKNIGDTEDRLSHKIDAVIETQQTQTKILEKQDARLERLEDSVTKLIDGQVKLISLVEKVLDVQDEQKDLIEALAIRSTQQDAEIRRIKKKNII